MQSALLALSKSVSLQISHQMKLRTVSRSISAATLVGSTVWLPAARAWFPSPLAQCHHQYSTSLKLLLASVTADEEALSSSFRLTEKPIAEGTILSTFPGGLTAVRVDEELDSDGMVPALATLGSGLQAKSSVSGDLQGKQVVFPNGSTGVVVGYRAPVAFVYNSECDRISKEGPVQICKSLSFVSVSSVCMLVDCFGRPLDGSPAATNETNLKRPIFAPIPQVKDIALINNPMLTGVTMIDALAPIGRGQNMLLIGPDLESMRGYAMDMLQTQLRKSNPTTTKCVYATTEPHEHVMQRLQAAGIDKNVHVVAPSLSSKERNIISRAAEAVTIAGTACAIAEAYALQEGMNSLVIVDTIDMHKLFWDATTRSLVDVFGVDAVVEGDRTGSASSEMRAFYSSLVQRSGQYKANRGGGSVTLLLLMEIPKMNAHDEIVFEEAEFSLHSDKVKERIKLLLQRKIPLTADTLRKINIPIPSATEGKRRVVLQHVDDMISMSDGQIWLDERLSLEPPMDPQRSVTRIGIGADTESRADAPAMRRVAEGLRLQLSQAASLEGVEETAWSRKEKRRQQALLLAMHQKAGTGGRLLSESCAVLLAASSGALDQAVSAGSLAGTEAGVQVIEKLLVHLWAETPKAMEQIDETFDMAEDARVQLVTAISSFFA
jgi:F0F1-type ATP synthase alpha subunit